MSGWRERWRYARQVGREIEGGKPLSHYFCWGCIQIGLFGGVLFSITMFAVGRVIFGGCR